MENNGCSCNNQLNVFTGNALHSAVASTGNQMFISYTDNGFGALGKGFSASLTFSKKMATYNLQIIRHVN